MIESYNGFIKKMILSMHKLLDDLKWQIEAGIDDLIGDQPNKKENSKVESILVKEISKPTESSLGISIKGGLHETRTVEELKDFLLNNNICDLQKSSKNLVFSDGDSNSNIMIISGTPDSNEDNEGMPIIEKKGELFNNILSAANLTRSLVYIAPIIPWKINGNRDLTSEEKIVLLPIVKKHIEIINPKILIFLGLEPIKYLLDNDGMMKMRGKWLNYNLEEKSIECLPILDPGFLIRRPEYKRETWNDILSLKEKIKELI